MLRPTPTSIDLMLAVHDVVETKGVPVARIKAVQKWLDAQGFDGTQLEQADRAIAKRDVVWKWTRQVDGKTQVGWSPVGEDDSSGAAKLNGWTRVESVDGRWEYPGLGDVND